MGSPFLSDGAGSVFIYNTTLSDTGVFSWGDPMIISPGETYYGNCVDIWDVFVVVGSHISTGGLGVAYVYILLSDTSYELMAELNDTQSVSQDFYGYDVAIESYRIVVGAPFDDADSSNQNSGAAFVYRLNFTDDPSTGNWVEEEELIDPYGEGYDAFGTSVGIHGDVIVVGAPYTENYKGSIHIWQYIDDEWTYVQNITDPNGADNLQFGRSVAIAGDYIVAGSKNSDSSGFASVYNYTGESWVYVTNLIDDSLAAGDKRYKNGVAISEDGIIVVGSPYDDVDGVTDAGSITIYWNRDGEWEQNTRISEPDANERDYFGAAVDIEGKQIAIGGHGSGLNHGKVHTTSCFETEFTIADLGDIELPTILAIDESFSFNVTISAAGTQPDGGGASLLQYDCTTSVDSDDTVVTVDSNFTAGSDSSVLSIEVTLDDTQLATTSMISGDEFLGILNFCIQIDITSDDTASAVATAARGVGLPRLESRMLASQVIARDYIRFEISYEVSEVGIVVYTFNTNEPTIDDVELDYAFEVEACLCTEDYECDVSGDVYSLNSRANICIIPNDNNAYVANFAMSLTNEVIDFTYTPVDFGSGEPSPDAITQVTQDGQITMASIFLVSDLFEGSNENVVVKGNVYLSFIDSGKSLSFTPFQLDINLYQPESRYNCWFPILILRSIGDLITNISKLFSN